jgi:RNA polymerase sigma factor (sigma-70 family)
MLICHQGARTDQELVVAYLRRQRKGLRTAALTPQAEGLVPHLSLGRDRELTEDLFQETFIKVVHTLKSGKYNEEGKFLPWVMRIAHNLVIDHFRRVKKMPLVRSNEDHDVFATIASPVRTWNSRW